MRSNKLQDLVSNYRTNNQLVGLGAIISIDGAIKSCAVPGLRQVHREEKLHTDDKWHIGSITKSITATMIARLVEKKLVNWNTTVESTLGSQPEADRNIHPDWRKVTMLDLLTHTSGVKPNFPISVLLKRPKTETDAMLARKTAVLRILQKPTAQAPQSQFIYSNIGYTIAGLMAEIITEKSWEELIRQEVFVPLSLDSAGFGAPNQNNQPRGHKKRLFRSSKVSVPRNADNTTIMAPAGGIHMSLRDLTRYAQEHLNGQSGQGKILSHERYKVLHQTIRENYACGWVKHENGMYWHNGSNTMWYAFVAFDPDTKSIVAVTANDPDVNSSEKFATDLIQQIRLRSLV